MSVPSEKNTDMDSHIDTCILSDDTALFIHNYDIPVTVNGYSEKVGKKTYQTLMGVVAYTTHNGTTWYLHIHQVPDIPGIRNNLQYPMQLRDSVIRVNDEPEHMVPNPSAYHHANTIPDTSEHEENIMPLSLQGVTHYFPMRKPTREVYNNSHTAYHN